MRGALKICSIVAALGLLTMMALFLVPCPKGQKSQTVSPPRGHLSHPTPGSLATGSRVDRDKTLAAGRRNASQAPPGQASKVKAARVAPNWAATPSDQMRVIHFRDPEKVGPYADRPTPGMAQFGEPASAQVTVAGRNFALAPNQSGEFQRVYVPRNSTVAVDVTYPAIGAGAPVFAEVLDGGRFIDGSSAMRLAADSRGRVGFNFQTDAEPGTYRVLLRVGEDQKTIDIWVGPPLAVRSTE